MAACLSPIESCYDELDSEITMLGEKLAQEPEEERPQLTKSSGVFAGPSGKETYYNLPMGRCIDIMRDLGYGVEEYPYWVREDGAKMLGEYVMCAANLGIRPKGTIVETSLGAGIVVDTGSFAVYNATQLDLAVTW